MDELEWRREDAKLTADQRDHAVNDLIALVGAVDGILQMQAGADGGYFLRGCGRTVDGKRVQQLRDAMLKAYRWQYNGSSVPEARLPKLLGGMVTEAQSK